MYGRRTAASVAACATIAALAAIAAPAGGVHAQADGELIPAWVKSVFAYYVDGQITEAELVNALQYLIEAGVINVAASPSAEPAAAPVMSAEATSYILQAEALEQASIESRMAMIELMSIVPMASTYMEPAEYDELQEQAAAVQALAAAMDTADAAHITAMRNAAADGTITAAEQAGIEVAEAAASRATSISTEATMAIMPALQQALLAASLGAFVQP